MFARWKSAAAPLSANNRMEDEEVVHRRKLTAILRYIASMHTTLNETDASCSFVQTVAGGANGEVSDFFQYEDEDHDNAGGVLFSTENFRMLLAMEAHASLFPSPPFSFYAAASSQQAAKKRTFAGAIKNSLSSPSSVPEKACWLRITRLTNAQVSSPPVAQHPDLKLYLDGWLAQTPQVHTLERLLTRRRLEKAPKIPPTISSRGLREIKTFLRQYKRYLKKKSYQRELEPIYNRLFEWIQNHQSNYEELVWGLGHARMLDYNNNLVNGPVLEILMEVELARDGALLVRPREHTGVSLNRQVVGALSAETDHAVLQQLHRTVAELEASELSPGQPSTYVPLMKQMAVQLSSGGSFQPSSLSSRGSTDPHRLVVTEGWCLYARPKPSSVWARDATAFADQLSKGGTTFPLPKAAWSLTHGPGCLKTVAPALVPSDAAADSGVLDWLSSKLVAKECEEPEIMKPLFPLPASDAQHRIADLLLDQELPAVVCEGPPGTGKTQTIANLICAYLCRGKRVLVTSKNAPALSVLRTRLPVTVQELCVDVSSSELVGMRQLQQTVERLANRVASANSDTETQKYLYLQQTIEEHEKELAKIDSRISQQSESIRQLVKQPECQEMIELAKKLIDTVPWLMKTITKWSPREVSSLKNRLARFVLEDNDPVMEVSGISGTPSDALVSLVASEAGQKISVVANAAKRAVANLPIVGSLSGMDQQQLDLEESLAKMTIHGTKPTTPEDWTVVLTAVKHAQDLNAFIRQEWKEFARKDSWPGTEFLASNANIQKLVRNLDEAARMKELAWKLNVSDKIEVAAECRSLDAKRSLLAARIQSLAAEVVDASVVAELSRSFSVEAQSALIRFAQIAGKAKFTKTSVPSKMSQRQRRRRQEYLDAFDQCCRFIPCWIATQSQISDYLPSECLFDLVVTDESSQSDVTALPSMLRGRQWLIVGDGKQVSPTESFISEEQIETLRAALPSLGPLEDSLLPGQSFFDLCAQAFPNGRVVLNEHFRCASEIIEFSNSQFYDGQLIPLRLPMKSERITPSIVDIRIPDGAKVGKVNEKEANEIVRLVEEIVSNSSGHHRSIGVISLMGDEQSRLIRGRLLDAIGPHQFARHDILVGDPPTFQGDEKDIILLSMVCSPQHAPTQSQLMHFQRANVALSRARDQIILVRSLGISDVSNGDVKIPIIEFFSTGGNDIVPEEGTVGSVAQNAQRHITAEELLTKLLTQTGYIVRPMGVIWKRGLSVEHPTSDMRAALMIDCAEGLVQEWQSSFSQQKAIERVGWKSMRIDILSLLTDYSGTLDSIRRFLSAAGVEPPAILYDELDEEYGGETADGGNEEAPIDVDHDGNGAPLGNEVAAMEVDGDQEADADSEQRQPEEDEVIVISSDDENEMDSKPRARVKPEPVASGSFGEDSSDDIDETNFGNVVDLAFLRSAQAAALEDTESEGDDAYQADQSDAGDAASQRAAQRRRRRLDRYQRDGRWYPKRDGDEQDDEDPDGHEQDWFDVDEAKRNQKRRRGVDAEYMPEMDEL